MVTQKDPPSLGSWQYFFPLPISYYHLFIYHLILGLWLPSIFDLSVWRDYLLMWCHACWTNLFRLWDGLSLFTQKNCYSILSSDGFRMFRIIDVAQFDRINLCPRSRSFEEYSPSEPAGPRVTSLKNAPLFPSDRDMSNEGNAVQQAQVDLLLGLWLLWARSGRTSLKF